MCQCFTPEKKKKKKAGEREGGGKKGDKGEKSLPL